MSRFVCGICKLELSNAFLYGSTVKYRNICFKCASGEVTSMKKDNDPVNHPKHYTSDPSGVECIQVTRHRNFNIGNAIKYLWRAGLKHDVISDVGFEKHIEDLKKAIWYINDEIKRITKTNNK